MAPSSKIHSTFDHPTENNDGEGDQTTQGKDGAQDSPFSNMSSDLPVTALSLNITMDERLNNFRHSWNNHETTLIDLYDHFSKTTLPLNYDE